jgi:hypothetical protein
MDFLSDEFLRKYPNIKKFLESRRNSQEKVTEIFGIEEVSFLEFYSQYNENMSKFIQFIQGSNLINGKNYLDYALELQKDFEKEKLKNGISN